MFILTGAVTALHQRADDTTMNMQLVPKERRGSAGNTNFLGVDVGMLIGPSIAGFFITGVQKTTGDELLGYRVMYRAMVLPVVAVVLFAEHKKAPNQDKRPVRRLIFSDRMDFPPA